MVPRGYELGSRAFSSLRVWGAVVAMTFAFCEGAGFGAFSFHCLWYDPFSATQQCTLTAQALLPPAVSWPTFGWNVATLWLGGLLDGGFVLGLILAALVLGVASCMSSAAVMRVFRMLPIAATCAIVGILGYAYEVQATVAAGLPQIRL